MRDQNKRVFRAKIASRELLKSGHVRSRYDGRARTASCQITPGEPGRSADRQALAAWFQRRSQLRGGWSRRPKGDAPGSEAGRAGGSLAVASSTPATPLLSPAKIRELNHAAFVSLSYPTDRQVLRSPHIGRPGFLVSMNLHPRAAVGLGRHAGLLLTPNCQRW